MRISVSVPHDEKLLRRTVKFLLRPQLKFIRIMGGVLVVLGLVLVAMDPSDPIAHLAMILGLLFVVAVAPIAVARSMRGVPDVLKHGFHVTLDDEWAIVTYPLAESRFRWAGLGRVVETPEVWYIMFGKYQAVTIPKGPMTEEQREEFAAFVGRLQHTRG
ncbi:hypothetical protein GCM10023194_72320 [Planotetraspora phitsanulokensis]|uniref:YcxB-like C-terminal domain-containing protein n=1 Tax=Planotetraspora phitsanulokensis TaxID=575192 RepID=A0A8J3U2P5_9ACTN|nr:YcxB family protein [Planotetraspora phitsanulokensis]GII37269.1 hypothetical protein Pph01_22720 [Planotetraspora phitsanulokensis]